MEKLRLWIRQQSEKTVEAKNMDEVFYQLARGAKQNRRLKNK
jgi:hypothetical protein